MLIALMYGLVHLLRIFITSLLHPRKTEASVVSTLQMRKLRPRKVKGIDCPTYQLVARRGPWGVSPACWRRSCIFKVSRSGLSLPDDCVDISFLFSFASSVTKALSGDHPVYPWRGAMRPCLGKGEREGNLECAGPRS